MNLLQRIIIFLFIIISYISCENNGYEEDIGKNQCDAALALYLIEMNSNSVANSSGIQTVDFDRFGLLVAYTCLVPYKDRYQDGDDRYIWE